MYLVPRQEWHKDEAQNGKRGNADQNQEGELLKKTWHESSFHYI